jgi:uncharacterized protein YfbU (UPF0304 family)
MISAVCRHPYVHLELLKKLNGLWMEQSCKIILDILGIYNILLGVVLATFAM